MTYISHRLVCPLRATPGRHTPHADAVGIVIAPVSCNALALTTVDYR
jgi:hypothetical protein